jgi:hypothetical protein
MSLTEIGGGGEFLGQFEDESKEGIVGDNEVEGRQGSCD